MELWSLLLSIINSFILILLVFFQGYFSEKGKNYASKEDLEELTRIVEEVRSEHASDLEQLKAKLKLEGEATESRRRVYEKICNSLRVFIVGHNTSQKETEDFHTNYALAWLWATDLVIEKLNYFLDIQIKIAHNKDSVSQDKIKSAYADILLAMRKDVGFFSTALTPSDYKFVYF